MKNKSNLLRGSVFTATMLLSLAASVGVIMEKNRNEIDGFFNTHSQVTVTTDDGTLYSTFVPDDKYLNNDGTGNSKAIVDEHIALNTQMSEEGSVLLKNNGALPLNSNSSNKMNITLLGIRSHVILAGSGMGVSANAKQVVQLEDALSEDFNVNPTMSSIYGTLNETIKLTNNDRAAASNYNPKEPSLTDIAGVDGNYQASFNEYSDAAIVVVGRPSSEMGDYAPGAAGVDPTTGASTALQLTTNEKDIIELATEKFDKVIVLVNTNSAIEIDDLKNNDKIDAILWVGHPGCYGVYGINNILCGKANPSGHLYDTYAADSLSSPAMQNMGTFTYGNPAEDFTRTPSNGKNDKYLIEAEGIYTGYKYYETRYEDVVLKQGNADSSTGAYMSESGWDYSKEVSYPFGYGLSYTTFTQEILDISYTFKQHEISADLKVKVTNTGDVAGKSVVQVYGQAPYIEGGVEKASIQLLNYDKTDVIEPNKDETLTIHIELQNLASWDSEALDSNGSYILDEGNYYFAIGNGAHDALNNVLAKKGKTTADGMTENGDANKAILWKYDYAGGTVDQTTFNVTKAGTQVKNSLEEADWNYWEEGKVTYLSRSDWEGTYPKTYENMIATDEMVKAINGRIYQISTNDDMSDVIYGQEGNLKFGEMKLADFDDPRWEELLNQLDLTEALNFILNGNRVFTAMESVGFIGGRFTENGPNGIGGRGFSSISYNNFGETTPDWLIPETDENASFGMNIFPSAPVVASTFNPEIAYEQGRLIGNDALFTGLPIIWGPGMNTHRHPYNGRSGEYYSEDPILTGVCGMEFAIGALDKGLIAAPKHYAFNDQEANRTGIAPYLTEQRARETELRAFQIAFEATKYDTDQKDVGMLGVMTSFSRIGPTEVTCSSGMLKEILRTEWGFNGYIVSDMNDDTDLFFDCIMGGLSSFDSTGSIDTLKSNPFTADDVKNDKEFVQAVKDAVHYNLYVLSQSNYVNTMSVNSHTEERMVSWRIGYVSAIATTAALTLLAFGLYAYTEIKQRKENA